VNFEAEKKENWNAALISVPIENYGTLFSGGYSTSHLASRLNGITPRKWLEAIFEHYSIISLSTNLSGELNESMTR
jgi:hypothetical protein